MDGKVDELMHRGGNDVQVSNEMDLREVEKKNYTVTHRL